MGNVDPAAGDALQERLTVAAHELSEPLRTVVGFLRLLDQRYADRLDDRGRELVAHALDGADRMQGLIDGMIDYARLDREPPVREPVDLGAVAADARAALESRIRATGASVTVGPLPAVLGDAAQLDQALRNLLSNALKFTRPDEPPRVEIGARDDGPDCWVLVADHGIGIEPASRTRVFEMFHRLHGADRYAGSGLGLAIVQRIVERHGGRIRVDETPGGGTTVAFALPLAPALGLASQDAERSRTLAP